PTGVPAGATVLRTTTNSYYNPATTSSSTNVYAKRDLATITPLILNAPQETIVGASDTQFSYDNQAYGTAPTIGHTTQVSRLEDSVTPNQLRNTTYRYDSYRNKTTITDPNNKVTQYFYEDATHANQTKVVVNPGTSPATEQPTTMV